MGNAGTIQPLHKTHFHGWGSWKKASVDKLELLFFACASHDSHTWGEGRWRHILRAQKQKRKKKTLLQAHVSCARLQVQQLQDKKNGGDPWMCGGYKHTQAHVFAFFACGHEGAVLRHPERATAPPPPSTNYTQDPAVIASAPKLFWWCCMNSGNNWNPFR